MMNESMKLTTIKTFLLIVLWFTAAFSGDPDRIPANRPFFVQGVTFSGALSLGFSGLTGSPVAAVAGANPAALSRFSAFAAGLEFQEATETEVSPYVEIKLRQTSWRPSAAGAVFPWGDLRLALGYRKTYSAFLDYGKMQISTAEHPEGTGEYYHNTTQTQAHQVSALASYAFHDLLAAGDELSIGAQSDWNTYAMEAKLFKSTATGSDTDWGWKAGLLYSLNEVVSFAARYASVTRFAYPVKIDPPFFSADSIAPAATSERFVLPARFALGLSLRPLPRVNLALTGEYVHWQDVDSALKNRWELSARMLVQLNERLTFSLGMYNQDFGYQNSGLNNSATFVGGGLQLTVHPARLYLEVYDNHLSGYPLRKQVVARFGMEFELRNF